MERTLVLIKPDAVTRQLSGEIITRFEKAGLIIKGIKMLVPQRGLLEKHYEPTDSWLENVGKKTLKNYQEKNIDAKAEIGTDAPIEIGKMVVEWLFKYMTEGPVIAIALEGYHAADNVRRLCGYTVPFSADVGSIRGDYSLDSPIYANAEKRAIRNLVHASEDGEFGEKEIALWFSDEELIN